MRQVYSSRPCRHCTARRYGRYVLVELLGIGGMGEVALALTGHPGDFKRCVVKRLFPDCRGDAAVEERFRREGELVSRLSTAGCRRHWRSASAMESSS